MFTLPESERASLSEGEQQILVLIFLLGETNVHTVKQVGRALVKAANGSSAVVRDTAVGALVDRLKSAGLVRQRHSCLTCVPFSIASQRTLFALPEAREYMRVIEDVWQRNTYDYEFHCLLISRGHRCQPAFALHEALLNGNMAFVEPLQQETSSNTVPETWHTFCAQLATPILAEPSAVSPAVLLYLFASLSETALKFVLPSSGLTEAVVSHICAQPKLSLSPMTFLSLCAWFTWTGARGHLATLASTASQPVHESALAACTALLNGDWGNADKAFAKTLKLFTVYPACGNVDACGNFFFLAALTAIRANVSQSRVRSLLAKLDSSYEPMNYVARMDVALYALNALANQKGQAASISLRTHTSPMEGFACCLASLFVEACKVDKSVLRSCVPLLVSAHSAGYAFMAASLAPCVRHLSPRDPAALQTCRLVEAAKAAAPLWGEAHVVAAWEHALTEIEALLPKTKSGSADAVGLPESTHRLLWIVTFRMDTPKDIGVCSVVCRLLKRLKSGGWSVGVNLSLDKIREGEFDAYFDAVDRPVKDALSTYLSDYSPYDSFYDQDQAHRVLPSLIGNPRVYTPKASDKASSNRSALVPIRIERGEPTIDIRSANGGASSTLHVPWAAGTRYKELQITCEQPGVYTVYEMSRLHQQLASIVAKYGDAGRLAIPAQGGEPLKRLLVPLAQVVGVKGEFDAEAVSARAIEGGVNLHLRANFAGATMHFDLKNQPVADLPTFVTPGHGSRKILTRHNSETVAIIRDLDGEDRAFAAFTAACPSLDAWASAESHWEVDDFKDILDVLSEVHALADRVSLDWPEGGDISVQRPHATSPFSLTSSEGSDFWLEIGGNVMLDDGKVLAFTELLSKLDDRTGTYVRLSDRRFLCLTKGLARQMELLARAGEVSKAALTVPPSAIALLDTLAAGKEAFDFPSRVRDRIADFRRAFKADAPVPSSLTCELRPYQRDGFVWLAKLAACGLGACLADDMGLGKTVQVLALLTARAAEGPSLVIAPTSVIRNWADEAARFAPALRVTLLAAAEDRTLHVSDAGPYDVLVCSYGLLPFEEDLLAGREWNVVVLDEAQAVKNRLAKRAKIVKRFKGRMRVAATGTPVENNLTELWSLFDFLNPGLLGTHAQFERRFCNSDGSVSALLKKVTAPFILRRLKAAVLDELPPKTEITLTVTLDEEERALYESCRREALATLEDNDDEANRITILAHLTKLRRVCCHPSLLAPECALPGQKVEAFLELIGDLRANGHRALVFSQFVDFLAMIRARLDKAGVTYQYLDGSTPLAQRADAVSRFQHGEGDLFLISLKAGGTGLNLTAASYVILLDPWWNPAVEMQAADRAHRIGQRNPVTVYRLVTADTVEERVIALHAKKLALAEAILDDTASTRLSACDLLSLFKA